MSLISTLRANVVWLVYFAWFWMLVVFQVPQHIVKEWYRMFMKTHVVPEKVLNDKILMKRLEDKNILITGATSGIGEHTARVMSRISECNLILACRNKTKTMKLIDEMIKEKVKSLQKGNASLKREDLVEKYTKKYSFFHLDLTDLASVKKLVIEIKGKYSSLYSIVNNAGVGSLAPGVSKQGVEIVFQVNFLGHWLLTNLLVKMLEKDSRVIGLSSVMHFPTTKSLFYNHKFTGDGAYLGIWRYCRSKMAMNFLAKHLMRKFNHILAFSLHPGAVDTNIFVLFKDLKKVGFFRSLFRVVFGLGVWVCRLMFKTPSEGCQTTIHLIVTSSKRLRKDNGGYFADCRRVFEKKLASDVQVCNYVLEKCNKIIKEYLD